MYSRTDWLMFQRCLLLPSSGHPDDGGSKHLWNVTISTRLHGTTSKKTVIFMLDFVETISIGICIDVVEVKISKNEMKSVFCHGLREYWYEHYASCWSVPQKFGFSNNSNFFIFVSVYPAAVDYINVLCFILATLL
jgi:hypothetical protein